MSLISFTTHHTLRLSLVRCVADASYESPNLPCFLLTPINSKIGERVNPVVSGLTIPTHKHNYSLSDGVVFLDRY